MAGLAELSRRTALIWLGLALLAALVAVHSTSLGWLPPGPLAADPQIGAGSDWDWHLELAVVADAYAAVGRAPEWDPFAQFGEPLRANPQAAFNHPAYQLGQQRGGFVGGFTWLYGWCVFSLCLGLAALAAVLGVPPLAGMATVLLLLLSGEWISRLTGGHLWILGISTWPAAFAATLAALEPARPERVRWLLAVLAGAALGTCLLMGSHYGAPMGITLVLFLVWATGQSPRLVLGLLGLLWLPVVLPTAPTWGRIPVELGCFAVFLLGLRPRDRLRERVVVCVGVVVGLLVVGGARLAEASWLLAPGGRLSAWSLGARDQAIAPLALEVLSNRGSMETYLALGSPLAWLAAVGGLVLLSRSQPALAALAVGCLAIGWSSGRPLKPWTFVTAVPGTAAMIEHNRFQAVLLFLPALGYLTALNERLQGLGGRARRVALAIAVGGPLALFHGCSPEGFEDRMPPATPLEDARSWAQVRVVANESPGLLSANPMAGRVHPVRGHEAYPLLQHPAPDQGLAWTVGDDGVAGATGAEVKIELDRVRVLGVPGEVIYVAQRHFPGWTCDGAEIVSVPEGPQNSTPAQRAGWLAIKPGPTGDVLCSWRSPVRGRGQALRLLALILLVVGAGRLRPEPA